MRKAMDESPFVSLHDMIFVSTEDRQSLLVVH
ncbi:hypothetical protein I41_49330 [Lacipirellula limnantheis]|uniref:Uncharacterized protein n=1 Tax=Lacipirellula limnantheis TaxID=2528024 RepID=A0A517U4Y3_9BACT|nr:hypothetical protein I41_49330 [Lacipirellula limnantheis]